MYHMKSLLRLIKQNEEVKKLFNKMVDKMRKGQPVELRRYIRLLSIKDWWYLVFRTFRGRGAYLFIKILADGITDDEKLWIYVSICKNWAEAAQAAEADETDPEEENEVGPYPYPPVDPD